MTPTHDFAATKPLYTPLLILIRIYAIIQKTKTNTRTQKEAEKERQNNDYCRCSFAYNTSLTFRHITNFTRNSDIQKIQMKKYSSIILGCISWAIFNIGSFFVFDNFILGFILISVSLVSIIHVLKLSRSVKDKTNQIFFYLAPFLFGIVGGIAAYLYMRKRNPKLAENLVILGLLTLVVSALTYFIVARVV